MPSPADRPSLCVIGDSHLGSVRLAETQGLVDFSGYRMEYWGAAGPSFRGLLLEDGKMTVRGAKAQAAFAQINGAGRIAIGPDDFDELVLYGARVGSFEFFGHMLQRHFGAGGWQSRAVLLRCARSFLASSRAYRIGAIFSRDHGSRVTVIPAPLLTGDVIDHSARGQFLDLFPDSVRAGPEERAWLRQVLAEAAAEDGVQTIFQPDDTVVDGVFTDAAWAIDGAAEREDADHKSPAFAAMMLGRWAPGVLNHTEALRA